MGVKQATRRDFLRMLLGTGVGMYGLRLGSDVANAQAGGGLGFRVLVRLELLGGCDSHALWVPTESTRFAALQARRPDGMFVASPTDALSIGSGQPIGLNPNLAPWLPHLPETRFFLGCSNDLARGQTGSHENAQNVMSIGTRSVSGGFRGWTAAIFDNDPSIQLVRFLGARSVNSSCDTAVPRCAEEPPPSIETFETFRLDGVNFDARLGGPNNSRYVADVIRRLAEARMPSEQPSAVEEKFDAALRGVFPAIERIQDTLTFQSPLYSAYGTSRMGLQFRNVAMKVKEMIQTNSSEKIIFVVGLGGFDAHDSWASRTQSLSQELGNTLGTFMSDLKLMNADENVVVLTGTEFGRTIASNGSGTDHGQASTTIVMGGRVNGGANAVYGDPLTASQYSSVGVEPATMDTRGVIATVLQEFMGISPSAAFPGPVLSEFSIDDYQLFV